MRVTSDAGERVETHSAPANLHAPDQRLYWAVMNDRARRCGDVGRMV
jgi:hypothetical protein